jgi:hypothetical protein
MELEGSQEKKMGDPCTLHEWNSNPMDYILS